jgi:hypothetical protein
MTGVLAISPRFKVVVSTVSPRITWLPLAAPRPSVGVCLRPGHISSSCLRRQLPQAPSAATPPRPNLCPCQARLGGSPYAASAVSYPPLAPLPPSPPSCFVQAHPPTSLMEHLDLSGRPEFDVCNLPFSQEIRERIEFFEGRSLIVWIGKNRPFTDTGHVADAFANHFSIEPSSIQVSRHYPTDFLVTILDRIAFDVVATHRSFSHGGREFRLHRWSPRDQATRAAMRYYVHLSLEGLPLHLWSESFAAKVIGCSCSLNFTEEHSRRRESTEVFELVAWTTDPVTIPLRVWLTVTDPDSSGLTLPQVAVHRQRALEPKGGMVYDVLIHLSSVEDTRRLGPDGRPLLFPLHFSLGATDANQNVEPGHAPREDNEIISGREDRVGRPAAPPRHSCSVEY